MTRIAGNRFPIHPRLIFMGTPEFAVPPLKSLIGQGYRIQAVITQPERRKGRGRKMTAPPVKQVAVEHRIEVLQPERASDKRFFDMVRKKDPDLIIVVAFGQILEKNLLTFPKWGVINIHASLLPKYRGAAPIQWAILNKESKTGLTVMRMDEGLDTGPILFQAELPILRDETFGHLHDRLSSLAGEVVVESLARMAGNQIRGIPQDDSLATYAPKIERKDSLIDWKQPALEVSALIRALDPRPGAYTLLRGIELKLFSSRVVDESRLDGVPGQVESQSGEGLLVATGQGIVEIRGLQYPGKKRLPAPDFLRGFRMPQGTILGH